MLIILMKKNKPFIFQTHSAAQTQKLAGFLTREIFKIKSLKNALVLALGGELGTGKTTFIQGFLRGLGVRRKITSPTFIIIKSHKPKTKSYKLAYHIDCYRIKKPSELLKLGLKEILENPQNIVLIEWAEKIRRTLPKNTIWLKFKHGPKENIRVIGLYS
jgi:tRNA threonylcarbamoyladenosine biosynthesis protein TsaE